MREKENNRPIPFILVRLESPEITYADSTDMGGKAEFVIISEGKYRIKLRHKNYRPFTEKVDINRNSILEITLQKAY